MNRRGHSGFTLVEVTVVVAMMGLIAAVLAAVFTTVVRTAPANQDRLDDAGALLGLTTWLPQDVASAAPSSFITGAGQPSGCTGVPTSQNLLELRWDDGGTYVANYRFVPKPDGTGTIMRYTCALGGAARTTRMTGSLRTIPSTASPAPTEYPAPVNITRNGASGDYRGVRFEVIVLASDGVTTRSLLTLDAETRNVRTTLPPTTTVVATTTTIPAPPTNLAPTAANLFIQVRLDQRLDDIVLPATDPENQSMSATITSSSPQLRVDVTPANSTTVRVEARSSDGAVEGQTYQFTYTVSDGPNTSNVGTVTVRVNSSATPGTTTTTTTTSTTTVPCAAQITSVAPPSVPIRGNGKLDANVIVTITWSGSCIPLVLTFDPDPTDPLVTPQQLAFGGGTTVTIDKNAYTWINAGGRPWTFPLTLRQGANGPVMHTATLTVTS